MRAVIVADVHANLAAFEAVLRHAEAAGAVDALWSLGDIVGYGPEPGACIALLRRYRHRAIAGNHDLAAIGAVGLEAFNAPAAAAAAWTAEQLTPDERAFIQGLPFSIKEGDFTLVHGSLSDPVWEYLVSAPAAQAHFQRQRTPYCLVGHSHLPLVFFDEGRPRLEPLRDRETLALDGRRFVANPGGLGQPRDGDPRAAYALLDPEAATLSFHRVPYDVGRTQQKMREAGLPAHLIQRLERGR